MTVCAFLQKEAEETEHAVIVQDTAWDGYEKIPSWIMQGYGTMANEAAEQLRELEVNRPTHVLYQAGVGSSCFGHGWLFTNLPSNPPKFIIMGRRCGLSHQGLLRAMARPRIVGGDLQTIMAGLCGEPNTIGWGYSAQPRNGLYFETGLG